MEYGEAVSDHVREFDHVILTRFSAVLDPSSGPAPQDWLDYRLAFFYDVCLPSVLTQTNRDFRWLVWFDDRCDEGFRDQVDRLAAGAFEPVWTHAPFGATLRPEVARRSQAPRLLTTRLDSDDAIARDFVDAVQREARAAGDVDVLAIDFPVGLQLDRAGRVYADHLQSNHFVSLLEHRGPRLPRTVFVDAHPKLRRHAPTRRVVGPPMWLEVLHGSNLSNEVRGVPTDPGVVADRFDIHLRSHASVDRRKLWGARRRRSVALLGRRLRDPHAAIAWWRSTTDHLRGTHNVPCRPGPTLGERLQATYAKWRR